jgi:zinc protease
LIALTASAALLFPAASYARTPSAASVDVTRATLKNGLEVVVLRDPLAPVVSTWLNYKVGADEAPIEGLAHAQEHMLFRGSDTISASQFADTTAITGGTFNADTQNEITQYFFEMPAQYLDIALQLEASRAQGVLDSQNLWDQERGAITQEVTRDNSDAGYRLYAKILSHILAGTPYAVSPLGTVASFKSITGGDLKAFYDRWYHPNNAIYVIAGDVDPQPTIAKVRALFEPIPSAKLPARPAVNLQPLTPITYTDDSDDPVTSAFIGYRVPGYDDPDYFASEILNDVLNSARGALFELQATGKALATGAQAQTFPKAGISIVESDVPVSKPGAEAITDIEAVIDGYKKTGLPPELVKVAKEREVAQAEFSRNSVQGLATLWSQTLAVENRTPDEDLAGLERVTIDDVNRVLRKYYDNATASVAIATPKSATGGGSAGLASEDNTVIPTEHAGLPAFARDVLANLAVPQSKLAPATSTLPNGIKLIVQPENVSKTIVVRGQIGMNPGVQDPPGKDGVDGIVSGLLPFGTTTYSRIAYQTELDKIAADVTTGPGFSLDVLTRNFDRGLQLLADDELHPSFPADAFEIVKRQTVGELTGTVKSPDYLAHQALLQALYPPGDPARRTATPQTASSITLDDVKSSYASTYRPDLTTIVVIGDVTPEAARTAVEKYFGAWTAAGPKPNLYPPKVPPNTAHAATIPATGRIQSEVALSETLPLTYNDADYPVLRLANTVLSGGFYASLLFHDLRETHGYVYSVSSSLAPGHNRSTFSVSYGADPQNIGRAERLVKDDLTKLALSPLDNDRLTRAKALVLGELPVSIESFDGIGGQFLTLSAREQPLDEFTREAGVMLGATPATVQAAIAKWIRPNDFVRIVTGPAGT